MQDPTGKIIKVKRARDSVQVIEHLHRKHEALTSSTINKNE
jgi:hypothetical protein